MATIRIAIDAFAEHSDDVLHYEFTWTGNEREARAVINHVEAATVGHCMKPGNVAHGTLQRLNEMLANIHYPSEDDKATFRLAVIENPSRGDHRRTVLQRLAFASRTLLHSSLRRCLLLAGGARA
jgi:hypothetical protein